MYSANSNRNYSKWWFKQKRGSFISCHRLCHIGNLELILSQGNFLKFKLLVQDNVQWSEIMLCMHKTQVLSPSPHALSHTELRVFHQHQSIRPQKWKYNTTTTTTKPIDFIFSFPTLTIEICIKRFSNSMTILLYLSGQSPWGNC